MSKTARLRVLALFCASFLRLQSEAEAGCFESQLPGGTYVPYAPGTLIQVYVSTDPVYGLSLNTGLSEQDVELAVKRAINIWNEEAGANVKMVFAGCAGQGATCRPDSGGDDGLPGNTYLVFGYPAFANVKGNRCNEWLADTFDSFDAATGYSVSGHTGIDQGSTISGSCQQISWQVTSEGHDATHPDLVSVLLHEMGHGVFNLWHPDNNNDPTKAFVPGCTWFGQMSVMLESYENESMPTRVLKEYDIEDAQVSYGPRSQVETIYKNHYADGAWGTGAAIPGQADAYPLFRMGSVSGGLTAAVLGWVAYFSTYPTSGGIGAIESAVYNDGLTGGNQLHSVGDGLSYNGLSRPVAIASNPTTGEVLAVDEENTPNPTTNPPYTPILYLDGSDVGTICYRRSGDGGNTFGNPTCPVVKSGPIRPIGPSSDGAPLASTRRYGLTATYDPASDMYLIGYVADDSNDLGILMIPALGSKAPGGVTVLVGYTSWHAPSIACSGQENGCRVVYEAANNYGCLSWIAGRFATVTHVDEPDAGTFIASSAYSQCYELFDTPSVIWNPTEMKYRLAQTSDGDAIYSYSMTATGTSWVGTGDVWNNSASAVSTGVLGTLRTGNGDAQTQVWFLRDLLGSPSTVRVRKPLAK